MQTRAKEPPTKEISTIGLDLAKNVFQLHGVSPTDEVVVRKTLRRAQMLAFFESCRCASSAQRPAGHRITGRAS